MPERMTKEEAKIQQAIRAARIAKQTLLEENRDRMPLEVEEDLVKVKRPKAENVTIKIPNQDKEGYGLAGVEKDYRIKKSITDEDKKSYPYKLGYTLAILKYVHDIIKDKSSIDDLTDRDFIDIKRTIGKHKDILD